MKLERLFILTTMTLIMTACAHNEDNVSNPSDDTLTALDADHTISNDAQLANKQPSTLIDKSEDSSLEVADNKLINSQNPALNTELDSDEDATFNAESLQAVGSMMQDMLRTGLLVTDKVTE